MTVLWNQLILFSLIPMRRPSLSSIEKSMWRRYRVFVSVENIVILWHKLCYLNDLFILCLWQEFFCTDFLLDTMRYCLSSFQFGSLPKTVLCHMHSLDCPQCCGVAKQLSYLPFPCVFGVQSWSETLTADHREGTGVEASRSWSPQDLLPL